jgi:hypothetical protein
MQHHLYLLHHPGVIISGPLSVEEDEDEDEDNTLGRGNKAICCIK